MTLDVRRLGRIDFEPARALQHELVLRRAAGEIADTLLLCEHSPVVTLGRGTDPADVLDHRHPVVAIERGGEATYHGPGQAVGYLIRRLEDGARDLGRHLRLLESIVIRALATFGVDGLRVPGSTGVWVDTPDGRKKIASLGVAAKRWTTYHGFALNVAVDPKAFDVINPCGMPAGVMTSLDAVLGRPASMPEAYEALESAAKHEMFRRD